MIIIAPIIIPIIIVLPILIPIRNNITHPWALGPLGPRPGPVPRPGPRARAGPSAPGGGPKGRARAVPKGPRVCCIVTYGYYYG